LEWPAGSGITKSALAHIMVDIIGLRRDVQVAFVTPDAMGQHIHPGLSIL
jgi:hydrogenase maturation factor